MRNKAKDAVQMENKRREFLQAGFRLFSENNIGDISLQMVAEASGYGIATLYRYFDKKSGFVIAVAAWKWKEFHEENKKRRPKEDFEGMTAIQIFEFYLDSFLELYKRHSNLLRFNHFFGTYIQFENVDAETIRPFKEVIKTFENQFHYMYKKAEEDNTIRTDVSEQEMFSTTLHLMFAAVTRYAVGLFYKPESGFDALKELQALKEMLLARYEKNTLV